jgi:hypothetical protein
MSSLAAMGRHVLNLHQRYTRFRVDCATRSPQAYGAGAGPPSTITRRWVLTTPSPKKRTIYDRRFVRNNSIDVPDAKEIYAEGMARDARDRAHEPDDEIKPEAVRAFLDAIRARQERYGPRG